MKYYRFPENRAAKIGFGIFLFAMLYLARDTLFTTSVLGFNRSQFLMLGLIGAAGVFFLVFNRRNWKEIITDKRMAMIVLSAVILLLPMVLKRDWQIMYFSVLICLFFAVFLTYFISYQEVAKYYVIIMTVLGLYSVLAAYILRIPVDKGLICVPTFVNAKDFLFHNFGLSFVSDSYVKERNFGIFREPGVYQYFILLAMFLNTYIARWKNQRTMWIINAILAVVMLTTLATGGIIELALFAVVVFFDKKLYKNRIAWIAAVWVLAALAVAVVVIIIDRGTVYFTLRWMITTKLTGNAASSMDRIDAIMADFQIFLHNPILGSTISEVLHAVEHNTSSTLVLYAIFGVIGGTLNVAAWATLVWEKERKLWANLALLVILFMSFNTQNLVADVFFWLLPYMALTERGLPLLKKWKGEA